MNIECKGLKEVVSYSTGTYAVLIFITEQSMIKIVLNVSKKKFH